MKIFNELMELIKAEIAKKVPNEELQHNIFDEFFFENLSEITSIVVKSLKVNEYYTLSEHKYINSEFTAQLNRRWFEAFDSLEIFIISSYEIGSQISSQSKETIPADKQYLFETLLNLHARSILISKEILVLIRNGFADGAFSRWRTLHEISVTSLFISKHGEKMAKSYMDYAVVENYKELKVYLEKHQKLGFEPPKIEDIEHQEKMVAALKEKYGSDFLKEYGWTKDILEKSRRNFKGLEEEVDQDYLRSHYKWACNTVHAGSKSALYRVGILGKPKNRLAGPTDYGFADPAQSTALSLIDITSALVDQFYDYDTVLMMNILLHFFDDLKNHFFRIQKSLADEHANLENSQ